MEEVSQINELDKISTLLSYYKTLQGYKYTYVCEFGTTISFEFKNENLCHLIFGTVNPEIVSKSSEYTGRKGYDNIEQQKTTYSTLHSDVRKQFKVKGEYFDKIHELLEKPSIIYFNKDLPKRKTGEPSYIKGVFLLRRTIEQDTYYLFLGKQKSGELYPLSFFVQNKLENNYTYNQIQIALIRAERFETNKE